MSKIAYNLNYLKNKPRVVRWEIVVPKEARLEPLQRYDVVFDDYDLKIRKIYP